MGKATKFCKNMQNNQKVATNMVTWSDMVNQASLRASSVSQIPESKSHATDTIDASAFKATGTPAMDTGGPGGVNAPNKSLETPDSFCFIATKLAQTR